MKVAVASVCRLALWVTPIALLPLACAKTPPPPPELGPRLVLSRADIEVGQVLDGATFKPTFELHNEGDAPLRVLAVIPTCSCVSVVRYDKVVAPGSTGHIDLSVKTSSLIGNEFSKLVILKCNDVIARTRSLTIRWTKIPLLIHEPDPVRFSAFPGEPLALDVNFRSAGKIPVEVLGAKAKNGKIEVSAPETIEQGHSYRVHLSVPTVNRVESVPDFIVLTVHPAGQPQTTVMAPALAEYRDPVEMSPLRTVTFDRQDTAPLFANPPQSVSKEVVLRAAKKGFHFRVDSVSFEKEPPATLKGTVRVIEPGRAYRVRVTILKSPGTLHMSSNLVIHTSGDDLIPVRKMAIQAIFGRL